MPISDLILLVFFGMLAACIGSFLNVVIYRLPRDMSINQPSRSMCPSCGHPIAWYDNIPMVSWLVLRARCRHCGGPISRQYPLVEALNTILWVGLFLWYFSVGGRQGLADLRTGWPIYLLHAALLSLLLAASAIDLQFYIIPLSIPWMAAILGLAANGLTGAGEVVPAAGPVKTALALGGAFGLAVAWALLWLGVLPQSYAEPDEKPTQEEAGRSEGQPEEEPVFNDRREVLIEVLFLLPPVVLGLSAWALVPQHCWQALVAGTHVQGLVGSLFGLLIGGAVIWGSRILFTLIFGREALGLGDVHLMAGVGAVLGWQIPILAFFIGPVVAIPCVIVARMFQFGREIPFGPWLSAGTLVAMLFYDPMCAYLQPGLQGVGMMLGW